MIAKIAGGCKPGSIFTTDLALGALMAAPRCINSWDMIVVRKGGQMYLDVREGSSLFDTTVIYRTLNPQLEHTPSSCPRQGWKKLWP